MRLTHKLNKRLLARKKPGRSPVDSLLGYRYGAKLTALTATKENPAMPDTKTYTGGCHCGQVRFEVTTSLTQLISCNCSICTKHGLVLTFVAPQHFALRAGGDELVEYQFHKKIIHHQLCPVCGVETFAQGRMPDGTEMIAINVRCLDGIDMGALKPQPFDGKSL